MSKIIDTKTNQGENDETPLFSFNDLKELSNINLSLIKEVKDLKNHLNHLNADILKRDKLDIKRKDQKRGGCFLTLNTLNADNPRNPFYNVLRNYGLNGYNHNIAFYIVILRRRGCHFGNVKISIISEALIYDVIRRKKERNDQDLDLYDLGEFKILKVYKCITQNITRAISFLGMLYNSKWRREYQTQGRGVCFNERILWKYYYDPYDNTKTERVNFLHYLGMKTKIVPFRFKEGDDVDADFNRLMKIKNIDMYLLNAYFN